MSGLTIKQRPEKEPSKPEPAPRATAEVLNELAVKTGRAKPAANPKGVQDLGAKSRLGSYVTPSQKRLLRILAANRDMDMSEVVGRLIDEAAEKEGIK